ncbi:MAG: hypothetical protein EXS05_04060 [Planctomycetaceae bacterium]|nr:hypothetical protein [Planctomycetaceae bacterium]
MTPFDDGSLSKSRVFSTLVAQHGSSFCRFLSASSRKTGHFQVTLWGFGDYGQFDSLFDGSPDNAACFNASHHGKRVYAPKARQNAMLKYKE